MRIVHVIDRMDRETGGPAVSLPLLTKSLAAHGARVSIVIARSTGDYTAPPGVETMVGAEHLAAQIGEADVCHVHGVWDSIIHAACTICRQHQRPYIVRPCGMLDPWPLSQRRLKKRIYRLLRLDGHLRRAARLHCTSETEAANVRRLGVNESIIVEPNGVDVSEFDNRPEPGTFRQARHLGDAPLVLFLGRLHAKKGLDVLVPAWSQLKHMDAMLVLAGPDDRGYQAVVEQMIVDQGMTGRIHLVGMLNGAERIAALADADLFVMPSYHENFGVSAVEAMAAGTPSVLSDCVNVHTDVVQCGGGTAVPPEAGALVEAIDAWLGNEQLRIDAGARAAAFARERFDWSNIAQRWMDHYASIREGR